MESGKELGSESEPATEPTGTGQKRLWLSFATWKLRSQRESHSPGIETNKIAAAFPPAIRHKSVVALLREACTSPIPRRIQTVALLWCRLGFHLGVIRTGRTI